MMRFLSVLLAGLWLSLPLQAQRVQSRPVCLFRHDYGPQLMALINRLSDHLQSLENRGADPAMIAALNQISRNQQQILEMLRSLSRPSISEKDVERQIQDRQIFALLQDLQKRQERLENQIAHGFPQQQIPHSPPQQQIPHSPPQQQIPHSPPQQQIPQAPPQQQIPQGPPQAPIQQTGPQQQIPGPAGSQGYQSGLIRFPAIARFR